MLQFIWARWLCAGAVLWLTLRVLTGGLFVSRYQPPGRLFGTVNLFMALLIASLLLDAAGG